MSKQYTNIGGQAVIEGVMMRSPNAFVVAVRLPKEEGSEEQPGIRLRRDQWFGLSKRFNFLRKPFFRGVIMLIETMANGIVSLNYAANVAANEEKKNEKVDLATFFTILTSFLFGIGLFVFLPHALTALIESVMGYKWDLDSFTFHFVDGVIKSFIFIAYIGLIGLIPDIRRVFQYHGAEHKSIATFEAGEDLTVENAKKYSTLHPRCGTSFIFFLLFISIILFSVLFTIIPVGLGLPVVLRHTVAILIKIALMLPIAGISYEVIKFAGKHSGNFWCRMISKPGMMLQRLTTREPDDDQLEVALASIKAVLFLEGKYNLKETDKKILSLEEVNIAKLADIETTNQTLTDFLE